MHYDPVRNPDCYSIGNAMTYLCVYNVQLYIHFSGEPGIKQADLRFRLDITSYVIANLGAVGIYIDQGELIACQAMNVLCSYRLLLVR